jgi:hypothetical protein
MDVVEQTIEVADPGSMFCALDPSFAPAPSNIRGKEPIEI